MFSKNLKFYRLCKQMTKKKLAQKVNVTPMAITNYENGVRKPNMEILKKLATALDIRVADFLSTRNENIIFEHGEFRKKASLSESQQEYVRECVEEYFSRFITIVDILGEKVLPKAPICHQLNLSDSPEENAAMLRDYLGFAKDGPIEGLIGKLEDKGIFICECNVNNNKFSGMNGLVNKRPYIILNAQMNPERKRSTIIHELAHLMFVWSKNMNEKFIENMATAISGAFLFPRSDVVRELGIYRTDVTKDMLLVAIEYGISMWLLVQRAKICKIITDNVAKSFYIRTSQAVWRIAEPSRIKEEKAMFFNQLVYRAISEGYISVQRGSELLKKPYNEVFSECNFD